MAHERSKTRARWRPQDAAWAVVLFLAAVATTFEAWWDLASYAMRHADCRHVFFVPPVVAWLCWRRRARLRRCRRRAAAVGPAVVALGGGLAWLGYVQGLAPLWHGGSLLVVLGAVLSVVGVEVLVKFLPAVVATAFLIVLPYDTREIWSGWLQSATVWILGHLLSGFDVQVTCQGGNLVVGRFEFMHPWNWSGTRLLTPLIVTFYGFAFAFPLRAYVRALLLAASVPAVMAGNLAVLLVSAALAGYVPPHLSSGVYQLMLWLTVVLALLVPVGLLWLLRLALLPVSRLEMLRD